MGEVTREQIIEAARQLADENGASTLSRSEFERRSRISQYYIYKLFPEGGWLEVVRLAGLDHDPSYHSPLSDEDVLAEFHRVASALGKIPTWAVFESHTHVTRKALTRRFGDLQGTITRYRRWLEGHEPESPMLAILTANSAHAVPVPPENPDNAKARPTTWHRTDTIQYGPPINFRGLRHAPINEQGVVYLFGMVSDELGYLVKAIHTSFPDCEAKRCIDARNNRWRRVRVEFEYRSSNFLEHGHDATQCDVIVCWEHDWHGCPLEIVELRSVLGRLAE